MVFNSVEFLIFYPIVLLLYFTVPHKLRWVPLLAASMYFYMVWNWKLVFLILFTIIVSFASSHIIERYREKKALCRLCLIITLVVCFGVLFFYKYFNFLSGTVTGIMRMFGSDIKDFTLDLILPVGISFYTFQTLSYVIDVYRGQIKPETHFGYYMLYVTFFPQLVAGPIERPENLIPQLHANNKLTIENLSGGLRKMLIGFFKKVAVADLVAVYVNAIYNDVENANGFGVMLATVLFAVQIYCDFSGYTDIAIGCAEIMGVKLMQNFNRPYIAKSIKEFWGRWHISLSSWFKDYLYIPLGGNRCAPWKRQRNVLIVFLVSGLWHGSAWTFVLWGAIHGMYQVIGYYTNKPRAKMWEKLGVSQDAAWLSMLKRFNTFVLVCFAWIFFRANTVSELGVLISKLFTDWSFNAEYFKSAFDTMGLTLTGAIVTVLSIIVMAQLDRGGLERDSSRSLAIGGERTALPSINSAYIIWIIALAWILLLMGDGASSFIYFQF